MKIEGTIWRFGDHVDTDLIIPARYLNLSDENELARNCFADVKPGFACMVTEGDVLVAGENFGCGSSREHAPLAIKACGIRAVIAKSFARIFYRNAFNIGLPLLECPEAADALREGDRIEVDLLTGEIASEKGDAVYRSTPIPAFMRDIVEAGGLVNCVKAGRFGERNRQQAGPRRENT